MSRQILVFWSDPGLIFEELRSESGLVLWTHGSGSKLFPKYVIFFSSCHNNVRLSNKNKVCETIGLKNRRTNKLHFFIRSVFILLMVSNLWMDQNPFFSFAGYWPVECASGSGEPGSETLPLIIMWWLGFRVWRDAGERRAALRGRDVHRTIDTTDQQSVD